MKRTTSGGSILIVEDMLDKQHPLSKLLTDHGHSVRAAKSGRQALASIRSAKPDLVLLNLKLPDLSGYEVCAQLKADAATSDLPVVFLGSPANVEEKLQGFRVGGVDYIAKPFHEEEVLARVQNHLEMSRLRAELKRRGGTRLRSNDHPSVEVSNREQVEKTLAASEQRYRTILENMQDVYYEIMFDGTILEVSPSIEVLSRGQYNRDDLIGKSMYEFFSDHRERRALLARLHKEGSAKDFEIVLKNRDGSLIPCSISTKTWRDAQGCPVKIVGNLRDITERKQAEERLRASELYYRTISEASPDALAILDKHGALAFASPKALEMLGVPPEQTNIGANILNWISPEDHGLVQSLLDRILSGGSGAVQEVRLLKGDRIPFWGEINSSPILDDGGKVIGLMLVCRDVTERKRSEEALRQSESRYRAVLQSANDAIVTADSTGKISGWNRGAEVIFGYTYVEAIGQTLTNLMPGNFRAAHTEGMNRIFSGGDPHIIGKTTEVKGLRKDGTEFPLELSLATWEVFEGQFYTAIIRDITDRKRAEEELKKRNALVENLLENAPIGFAVNMIDNGQGLLVSRNFEKIYGVAPGSLHSVRDFFEKVYLDPEFRETMRERTMTGIASGDASRMRWEDIPIKTKDGTLKFITATNIPLPDHNLMISTVQDVTERNRAETAVRESEQRFRSVWERSADGMRLTDSLGRIIDVNEAYCSLVRMSREELVGEIFSKTYKRHGPNDGIELYQQRFATGSIVPRLAATIQLWNDDEIDVEISNSFIKADGSRNHLLSVFRDVTQRNKAERHLHEERNLLRTIIDAIPDEISVKDTERRYVIGNSSTVRALKRVSVDDIIGRMDEDLIPDRLADAMKWEENAVLAVGGHSRNKVSDEIDGETGEIRRSLLISKIPLKHDEDKVIGLVSIKRDVTELKRVEEMLEKERTLLRTLIESIPDEVCLKDNRHRYLVANGAAIKALGVSSLEALIGKTDWDLNPTGSVDEQIAEENAIIQTGERLINREHARIDPDTGDIEKCVLTTKAPVRDQSGKTIGILVVNRDITSRKKAEVGLRASEEKFRVLFEESKDCIFISSGKGQILDINRAGVEMFGYDSKEDLLQVDLGRDLYVDNQQRMAILSELSQKGFVRDFEAVLKRKDGRKLVVLETATAVRDLNGKVVTLRGTIRDVTKQRELERQVGQAQKMESLGLLAGGIAHDFNNILGIILGHASIVERGGKDPALIKNSTSEITTAVRRGASLVRQILTFARKSDPALEPVNVNAVIRELSKMIDDTFPKTISVSLDLEKLLPIVMMDQTQLHQALLNLCVNARDAIAASSEGNLGRGEIRIKTQVVEGEEVRKKSSEASASEYVCVSVSDSGVGMDQETRQQIFEPFFTTKGEGKGTGLGLSVVYGIVKAHHGHIEVESEVGRGTTFRAYLPVAEGIAGPVLEAEVGSGRLKGGKETILLVEDEGNLLELMQMSLEKEGYSVLTAMDGIEAIKVFSMSKAKIALVMTDLGLPRLDGVGVALSLREIDPKVKIILSSGYLDPNMKSNLLRSGAKDFIQKPYTPGIVLRKIREVLDGPS